MRNIRGAEATEYWRGGYAYHNSDRASTALPEEESLVTWQIRVGNWVPKHKLDVWSALEHSWTFIDMG